MTLAKCAQICQKDGSAYVGLQYSVQCFCGNTYNKYGPADNCDMTCSGDDNEICGGRWANAVYRISPKVLAPDNEPEVVPETEPEVDQQPQPQPDSQPESEPRNPFSGLDGPNPWKRPIFVDDVIYDEPDEEAEDEDDKYFDLKPEPVPAPKPKELGMANGIIGDADITASSYIDDQLPTNARPPSSTGWMPENFNTPYLQIDMRRPIDIHGFGSLGDYKSPCWVSEYIVEVSDDGEEFKPLLDESRGRDIPRVFRGNKDQNTWKRHSLHKYYGEPVKTRFIRFYPVSDSNNQAVRESTRNHPKAGCVSMRVELYGYRDVNDPQLLKALERDTWTKSLTGCQCYFDKKRFDCACCVQGGAQCPRSTRHQCVQPGFAKNCGIPETDDQKHQVDPWTASKTGCVCDFDTSRSDCACCQRYGCQCGEIQKNQCVQCGQTEEQCGNKPHKFGPPGFCRKKTCPPGVKIIN